MFRLDDLQINGESNDVSEVKRIFGGIEIKAEGISWGLNNSPIFTVRRFTNWYKDSQGKKPLYFLVPDRKITAVWPDNSAGYNNFKYGTASGAGSDSVVAGVSMHMDCIGIYICLSPKGEALEDRNSFGM